MTVAVITIAAGRHEHLINQIRGLRLSSIEPALHVVVSMGDCGIRDVVGDAACVVDVECGVHDRSLPLSRARNVGAREALAAGATILVFLDVDCVPGATTIARYADAAVRRPNALLCGPVTYLPPIDGRCPVEIVDDYTNPHPARPNPPAGQLVPGLNYDLFWSLSFAVRAQTWSEIGGFSEDYEGYGGEDTDFAASASARGVELVWVGGAHAYHQYHPVSSPPVEHLREIVANSRVFRARWHRWPMTGWLDAFEKQGLIRRSGDHIEVDDVAAATVGPGQDRHHL